jgi:hypothetical protein
MTSVAVVRACLWWTDADRVAYDSTFVLLSAPVCAASPGSQCHMVVTHNTAPPAPPQALTDCGTTCTPARSLRCCRAAQTGWMNQLMQLRGWLGDMLATPNLPAHTRQRPRHRGACFAVCVCRFGGEAERSSAACLQCCGRLIPNHGQGYPRQTALSLLLLTPCD